MFLNKYMFLVLAFCVGNLRSEDTGTYLYKQEFEALQDKPEYAIIFDKDAPIIAREIRKNLANYTCSVSPTALSNVLGADGLIVTSEIMPKLYSFIETLCKNNGMKVPVVLVTTQNEMFNAFASKILCSDGIIVIGKALLVASSDAILEGVLAHELGHIMHNHVNKTLAITLASFLVSHLAIDYLAKDSKYEKIISESKNLIALWMAGWITAFIVNKKFEKEADLFAYKVAEKGQGLKEFFQMMIQRSQDTENAWIETNVALAESKGLLKRSQYYALMLDYYLGRGLNGLENAFQSLYYNTPYGPHPSPEERIKAIEDYFASQEQ